MRRRIRHTPNTARVLTLYIQIDRLLRAMEEVSHPKSDKPLGGLFV